MITESERIIRVAAANGWDISGFPRMVLRKGTRSIVVVFYPDSTVKTAMIGIRPVRGRNKADAVVAALKER